MTVGKLFGILLLILFSSSLCCMAQNDVSVGVSNNFVNNTCHQYEEKFVKLCIDVVDSDPHEYLKLNASGLLTIFINHSIPNMIDNHSYLAEQLKRSDLDKHLRYIFGLCVEEYERGIVTLKYSLEELLKKGKKEFSLSMTDAFNSVVDCEFNFDLDNVSPPPSWSSRYLSVRNLLELAMGAANLLQCNQTPACSIGGSYHKGSIAGSYHKEHNA